MVCISKKNRKDALGLNADVPEKAWLTMAKQFYRKTAEKIEVCNTVGAGDSYIADSAPIIFMQE